MTFAGELWQLAKLQIRAPVPLACYAEDVATWNVLGPLLEGLTGDVAGLYVTSAAGDPRLSAPPPGFDAGFLQRAVPAWIRRLRAVAFLTTMPDLGALHVPRPPRDVTAVYTPHSLISMHRGYRPDAFDHYDVVFCAGPHHRRELAARFAQIGREPAALLDVGYPKLDRLAARFAGFERPSRPRPTIVLAPTWGRHNFLETAGLELVARLRAMDTRVVVRPHPCFWQPIYPDGRACVEAIVTRFAGDAEVVVERGIESEDAFLRADLLVSDFSGAAYEYAFASGRPVLFIDGSPKVRNPEWERIGLPVFEDVMRGEVGEVVAPVALDRVDRVVARLLHDSHAWRDRLAELRARHVYHPGHSVEIGAGLLRDLSRGSVRRS